MYIYIYTNLPVNATVRLPHPRSGDSQGQETFLAPSAENIYIYFICIYIYILYIYISMKVRIKESGTHR